MASEPAADGLQEQDWFGAGRKLPRTKCRCIAGLVLNGRDPTPPPSHLRARASTRWDPERTPRHLPAPQGEPQSPHRRLTSGRPLYLRCRLAETVLPLLAHIWPRPED